MTLTVKHQPANAQQIPNLQLLVQIAKGMGASRSQMAAAMATMIQESAAVNLKGGDRDSAGLYQQRPSQGWGSYTQVTTPSYAINKFLTPFLSYCRQGMGLFAASDRVQGSAYPQAPAQWYDESWSNVTQLVSGKDFIDATSLSGGTAGSSTTRVQPYEFSRGNAGQRENSWDCIGRLASEVQWDRFMRAGALWFVSETYLKAQPPRFAFSVGARGVTAINFDADTRRNAAEATVTALASRWSVLPGDAVTVSGEGPGDGLWLVTDTRRTIWDNTTEITLKRPVAPKLELTNTTTTTTVAGVPGLGGATNANAPKLAQDFYLACKAISDKGLPYVYGGGHGACGVPSGGGYDCSGSVCAALAAVHMAFRLGGPCAVSGDMATSWGDPGQGKYFTVWANPEHVWVQFRGFPNWRFDTSPHGDGPDGPRLRKSSRSTAGFTPKHWPNL